MQKSGKLNLNAYLNLNLKHEILIELNLAYRKPFMQDQPSLFRRKACKSLTTSLHLIDQGPELQCPLKIKEYLS